MKSIIVDAHLDMAYNAVILERDLTRPLSEIRQREQDRPPPGGKAGTALVSLPALKEGRVAVVGSSIFVAPASRRWAHEPRPYHSVEEAYVFAVEQLDYYRRLADEQEDLRLLQNRPDLDAVLNAWDEGREELGLFVVMEGAEPIRSPGELGWWVERGLRSVALSWSAGTRYAGGNIVPGLLSDEGQQLLDAMAGYNLLLDVSHLWEEAVYEVLDRYPGPLSATHANPRVFKDSPRLLSDAVIRRIAGRGGVVGIVPYNRMLDPDWNFGDPRLPLSRVAEAIDHVCQVTGDVEFVGLGSDFDGGFGVEAVPEGLHSVADLRAIGRALEERGYSEAYVAAVLHGNWLRVMRNVLEGTT